jgi:SAM-dependent methyltransferase
MTRYIIRGGLEGKKRLEILARALWPTTARLLEEAGLAPGMTCLDLGCGGGDVAFELARLVGPAGTVVGLDADDVKLDAARSAARRAGLTNLQFRQSDVRDWDEPGRYDLIYCRFLLTHLSDPVGLLKAMRRAVRPAGVVVIEDIDFGGQFCHPACGAFDTYARLYRLAAAHQGADADIGPKLYTMMLDVGWQDLHLGVVQPSYAVGEGKQAVLLTLINIADALLDERLIGEPELQAAIDELTRFTEDPRTVIGYPRVFQLWAREA